MQPWSPLPEHLRSYPCKKNLKETHHFNQFIFTRRKPEIRAKIQKVSLYKPYKVGFGKSKIFKKLIKTPPSSLSTHMHLNTSREHLSSRFQSLLGELGSCTGTLRISGGVLRVGSALRISAHLTV